MKLENTARVLLLVCALAFLGACNGGGGSGGSLAPPPPSITINVVSPVYAPGSPLLGLTYAVAGQGSLVLAAGGTGFTASTVLEWNGTPLPTQFGDSGDIAANVSSALIASPGTATITATDTATAAVSNAVPFGIASPATLTAGVVQLVTAAPDGAPANGNSLVAPSISSTGRYVAFQSSATNLVAGPASGYQEIYERDTCVGAPSGCAPSTIRITTTYDGSAVNFHSYDSSISADGRYVAFGTQSTNILPNTSQCAPPSGCVFLRDTCTGVSAGCSPSTMEVPVPAPKTADGTPILSPDGRFIAFDTGPQPGQVYIWDSCNGAPSGCAQSTVLVSAAPSGSPASANCGPQAVSSTGRYVAFDSWATSLVPNGPTDGNDHLYLRDTCIGAPSGCVPTTTWLDGGGSPGLGGGGLSSTVVPAITADGRLVAFSSLTNFASQDAHGYGNVYIRDACNGAPSGCTPGTALVSLGNDGSTGNDPSKVDGQTTMTPNGRFVVFETLASNLVPGDTFPAGGWEDILVRDTCFAAASACMPSTVRVSVTDAPGIATESNAISDSASISADGHYVVFLSSATNLVSPASNGNEMVYLAKTGF